MPETKVILSLGSNLGDRGLFIHQAVEQLKGVIHSVKASSTYETSPVDTQPQRQQPPYYNIALSGYTALTAQELLEFIKKVEAAVNAQAVVLGFPVCEKRDKGPRYIDIDIVFLGEHSLSLPNLIIPHSAYRNRLFVIIPLLEIEPDWLDPVTGEKVAWILERGSFPEQKVVKV